MNGHTDTVLAIFVSHGGKTIVTGVGDNTVRIWNFQDKSEECVLAGHTGAVQDPQMENYCEWV